jgi:APA family basic amino acid/polyamine antiporter
VEDRPALLRRLGPLDAAAIVVSNVIGGGIFFSPVIVAALVPSAPGMLAVWLAGGALAFAGATAYAELATISPQAGGEYVYLRDAFGPLAGFLTGWTSFVAGFSGAIAASSVALAEYIGRFVPVAADATPLVTIPVPLAPIEVSSRSLFALAAILLITAVHLRGLGPGRLVQNLLAGMKLAAIVLFLAVGFVAGHANWGQLAPSGGVTANGFVQALVPVMFTYSGWNAAAYVAEEITSPARNVPIALGLGTLAVVLVYLGLNALYLFALGGPGLAAVKGTLIDTVAEHLFGFTVGNLIALFTIVSIAASVSAMVLAGPRVYFAMARDGLFAAPAARVHPRFRAPVSAILMQAAWSSILVLSGSLSELVSYTGFAVILFSGIAVAALFVLRRREPGVHRPFRAWGYPLVPALFVVASALIVLNEIWRNPKPSLAGVAIIAAGIPVYWVLRRKRLPPQPELRTRS